MTLASLNPTVGDIVGTRTITTDSTGIGRFEIAVTNGTENAVFRITATLASKPADTAMLVVGTPTGINKHPHIVPATRAGKRISITCYDLRGRTVFKHEQMTGDAVADPAKLVTQLNKNRAQGVYIVAVTINGRPLCNPMKVVFKGNVQ